MTKRIQLRRVKGWRLPEGAVVVARPTIFGNPWTETETAASGLFKPECVRMVCVKNYRHWIEHGDDYSFPIYVELRERREKLLHALPSLRGKDLACWCPAHLECHADVLLDIANRE